MAHSVDLADPRVLAPLLPADVVVTAPIAVGAQGAVHRGSFCGLPAAVKVYFPGQLQKRVEREVEALRQLNSRTIVKLLWHGTITVPGQPQSLPLVVSELVEGTTLQQRLARGPMMPPELTRLARDVGEAIRDLWNLRLVHRDLNPRNIMIRTSGEACVIDLGVARHLDQSSLTAMGLTWGTVGYLSPEQMTVVRQLTCKSDLYTLGVILLEAALGQHPTGGDQFALRNTPYHLTLPSRLSQWAGSALLQRLLHPRATARPRPEDLLAALAGIP